MKKIIIGFIVAICVALVAIIISIPFINNFIAKQVVEALKDCPLPEDTLLLESVSVAGKLNGNGNGMQFFGAILIESELSLEMLEEYYSRYRGDEWSYIVVPQQSNQLLMIEHQKVCFEMLANETDFSKYYVVCSWGKTDFPLSNLDLRGH